MPLDNGQPKASERDVREWREVILAAGSYIANQIDVVTEGHAKLPSDALNCLECAFGQLDAFDRAMAKLDGASGAAGGRYELKRLPTPAALARAASRKQVGA